MIQKMLEASTNKVLPLNLKYFKVLEIICLLLFFLAILAPYYVEPFGPAWKHRTQTFLLAIFLGILVGSVAQCVLLVLFDETKKSLTQKIKSNYSIWSGWQFYGRQRQLRAAARKLREPLKQRR